MSKIYLSVIIPVYNTEKYISRCLDSVIVALRELKEKSEIIIINDGSTDNSERIIKKYLEENSDLIKYYYKENAGLADTKNVGIKYSSGEYLSFIDSDDYIDKEFYNDAIYTIKKQKADMIICDWETIDLENNTKYVVEAKNKNYLDDKWGCIDVPIMPSSCNKVVKKELFKNLEFPVGLRYEDLGTTLILFFKAKNIQYINKPYYKYCLTPNSIMRTKFDERNLQMIDILNILFDKINKLDISNQDKEEALYMVYTRRFYEELLEKISITKISFKERKKIIKNFCIKISNINKIMCKNKFFKYNVFNKRFLLKALANKCLHYFINKNNYIFLLILLNKKMYYKFISIKYSGDITVKKVKEEKENVKDSCINTML